MESALVYRRVGCCLALLAALVGCSAIAGTCEVDCGPAYDGPPPNAAASTLDEPIAWDLLEGHLAWSRRYSVFIADAANRTLTQLSYYSGSSFVRGGLALSPDAQRVAFAASIHEDWGARPFVVSTADGKTTYLAIDGAPRSLGTAWALDGSGVYVTVDTGDARRTDNVYRVLADGSHARRLPLAGSKRSVAVSPDGQRLAVGGAGIRVSATDGSEPVTISTPAPDRTEDGPAWSPDGARLAFLSSGAANQSGVMPVEIVLINADGTGRETLLAFDSYPCGPAVAWAPSGNTLAYNRCAVNEGGYHIHVLDLRSRESLPLTSGDEDDESVSWVP